MLDSIIEGVIITPLKRFTVPNGDVLHAMKRDDSGFEGFGEAYFSFVDSGAIKGWKRHKAMIMNLIVPIGGVRIVMFDERDGSSSYGKFQEIILSKENYCRLTIPPMIWLGFQCITKESAMVVNIANIPHVPEEQEAKSIESLEYDWSLNK